MSKQILVNASPYETRVAILENGEIRNLYVEREADRNIVGNIYKGVVKRVLPGMQAAFLELGLERTAFLYVDDIIENPLGSDFDFGDEDEMNDDAPRDESFDDESDQRWEPTSDQGSPTDHPQSARPEIEEEEEEDDFEELPESEAEALEQDAALSLDLGAPEQQAEEVPEDDGEGSMGNEQRPPSSPGGASQDNRRQAEQGPQGDRGYGRGRRNDRWGRRGGRFRGRGPRARRARRNRREKGSARIQDLIKEGQELLVQVAKAPIGTKGARLTTHLSIPGRNLVLMPTVNHVGVSRRIESEAERRRLRDIFNRKLRPEGVGFIIRTVAAGKHFQELKADCDYLVNVWEKVRRENNKSKAPALIHEDLSLPLRVVRDFLMEDVDSFIIDQGTAYDEALDFVGHFMPKLKSRVKLFKGPSQLFEHYGIEAEISRALGKKVWLKSGGYLLIDQSEALTSIDVNTGRYVGSKSLEETILKTNLEAVKEIAYQLQLRNVGGIIILDLIDMESPKNREKVFRSMQEMLQQDKSKVNILKISDLGLIEMTRKRTAEDLVRYLTESCETCEGRGYHKSRQTVSFEVFRQIEKEANSNCRSIVVFAAPGVVNRLQNEEKKHVRYLEDHLQRKIIVKSDPTFKTEQFEVFGRQ